MKPLAWPRIADFRGITFGGLLGVAASLTGCNWSPPTLAVELPQSTGSELGVAPPTAETAAPETLPPADSSVACQPAEVVPSTAQSSEVGQSQSELAPKVQNVAAAQLLGRWRDSFLGTRTLTLNADGSAKMELDLDFAGRLLYGKRLEFDMKWSLKDGVVAVDIVEGRPAAASKSAISIWGDRYEYLLDRVEADVVEMRSSDGSTNHTLRRLSADE